jgi:signal transduction histidine kinase
MRPNTAALQRSRYLYGGDDQIELTIRDSGIGFDLEEATGRGSA